MCGLVGIAGTIGFKEDKVLKTLLVLDSIRGEDSTGVAFVRPDNHTVVTKNLGNPYELFDTKVFTQAMKLATKVMIGHNRYATSGGISKSTAHPFDFDTLVGVHNGTLKNKHHLLDHTEFSVDSENLYHHIEQRGLKDAIDTIDGAWALVWWEKKEKTLNFLRNKERPLFMSKSLDGKTLFWASEGWMLTVACHRHDIKISAPIPFVEDMHYSFLMNNMSNIQDPVIKHMKSAFVPKVYHLPNQNRKWNYETSGWDDDENNVIPIKKDTGEKKPQSVLAVPVGMTTSYSGSKRNKLEIISSAIDPNGARFLHLMDLLYPELPIRLYLRRKDPMQFMVGRTVVADISGFHRTTNDGDFFKASPHNVEILPDTDDGVLFNAGSGKKLSRNKWKAKYPNCEYCFDHLEPDDLGNRLTSTGGCLCGQCAIEPSITTGLSLMKVC